MAWARRRTRALSPDAEVVAATAGVGRRLTAVTLDQAISSSSNILITIFAARLLDVVSFGLFGVVLLVYMTIQGTSRSLVGEPLLVLPAEAEDRPGEAIGAALILGVALSAVVAVGAGVVAIWSGDLGRALLALALCTPLLVLQDVGRYLAFATHRPVRAFALDIVWLGLLVLAVGALSLTGTATLVWFITAWAGSGALAGTLLLWQYRTYRIRVGLAWIRETWHYSWRYTISFMSRQGSVLVASSAMAGILGARALGAVRGALLLFGPLVQFQVAAVAAGVTEVARVSPWSPAMRWHVVRSTALTTTAAIVNLALVLAIPNWVGELILGDTWGPTRTLRWPAGVQVILIGLVSGVRSGLLGIRAIETTLRIDIATAVLYVCALVFGALIWDVVGTFWALTGGQATLTLLWWIAYLKHARRGTTAGASRAPAV